MEMRKITEQISYIPAIESPLSADIGIIRCDDGVWIFDVGNSEEAAAVVSALPGKKNVVLSHFHPDHAGNIERITYDALYGGAFTCRRFGIGTAVNKDLYFENGIHLFPLPSSHAKGCLGLEYGDYAFLGDATYSTMKSGQVAYNTGLLQEMLAVLKDIQAGWFLLSHSEPFACPKAEVVAQLEEIYSLRKPHDPYILI